MLDITTTLLICAALILFCLAVLPKACDHTLKLKYRDMDMHWHDMLEECIGNERSRHAELWLERQSTALRGGKLTQDRARALKEHGFVMALGNIEALKTQEAEATSFSFRPARWELIGYTLVALILPLGLAFITSSTALVLLGCVLSTILVGIVICDIQARIIPYQACILYGAVAVIWVIALDPEAIPVSIALVIASICILSATEYAAITLTGASAIGGGDRRLIPLITFQIGIQGLVPGLLALCAVAFSMAIGSLAQGNPRRSYLPFAPALMAYAVVGTVASTLMSTSALA